MEEIFTDWRRGFKVYTDNDERVFNLETYCPNWQNAGPYGVDSHGDRFLDTDWFPITEMWSVTYAGKQKYIYVPWLGSHLYNGSTYFANYFLIDENQDLLAYVPYKLSMYGFDVKRPDGEVVASADRSRFDSDWDVELFIEQTSKVTPIDVALLVHLYEYTFSKDDITLSVPEDTCTPFVLYAVPVICVVVVVGAGVGYWFWRKKQAAAATYEIVGDDPAAPPEQKIPLIPPMTTAEKAADKTD
jgi:hypothetical protein